MDNYHDDDKEKKRIRRIIMIIMIIILLLLLITSCTSKMWGKIGSWFTNERTVDIDNNSGEKEVVLNRDLKFESDFVSVSQSDEDLKLSFSYKNINPHSFSCFTSDASLATCYVSGSYVVVIPKKTGKVTVTLETEVNGKKYQATSIVEILDPTKFIELSPKALILYLKNNPVSYVSYSLKGITGDVLATVSDASLADVFVEDGVLKVVGKKAGKGTIIVTVKVGNKEYSASLDLTIADGTQSFTSNYVSKNGDSSLKSLSSSNGKLDFHYDTYAYGLSVPNSVDKLTLNELPNNSSSKVTYKFNGQEVKNLKDLELKVGENKIEIVVEAENGNTSTYTVFVYRSEKTSFKELDSLSVSEGVLTPSFNSEVTYYDVYVDSNVDKLNFYPHFKKENLQVTYKYNGQEVSDLNNLPLNNDENNLEITVKGEDGTETTYDVNIKKRKNSNNFLKDLNVFGFDVDFDKFETDFYVNVGDKNSVSVNALPENSQSKVKYYWNGKEVNGLKDLQLNDGDNRLDIVVESEDGLTRTYTVLFHKGVFTLKFDKEEYDAFLSSKETILMYEIKEDGMPTDYDIKDLKVSLENFKGTYKLEKGYIKLIPDSDIGERKVKVKLEYKGLTTEAVVNYKNNHFVLNSEKNNYNLDIVTGNNKDSLVLYTDMFTGPVTWVKTDYGVRIYQKGREDVYIDLYFDSKDIDITKVSGSGIEFMVKHAGKIGLKVKGYAYGNLVSDIDISIQSVQKYLLKLDANGGIFDGNTDLLEFKVQSGEFDLKPYLNGYYTDKKCRTYNIVGFQDDFGNVYTDKVQVTKDLNLKAVFSETANEEDKYVTKFVYLTDVDLFHNEEYFNQYHEDKVIYPGAHGSYIMTLNNNTDEDIKITNIILQENSVCYENKCLNMGYVIKDYLNNYYLHNGKLDYKLLNKNNEKDYMEKVKIGSTLVPNSSTEISLLWQWVEVDDEEDTLIGNKAGREINDIYALTVGIEYVTKKDYCEDKS